jgi:hypothetical protein
LADRRNIYSQQLKAIHAKRSKLKTDTEIADVERLEWEGALYWHDKLGLYIPNDNIERAIQQGAQKTKLGRAVAAAVWVADEIVRLNYSGPKTKDGLYKDGRFELRKGVVISGSRVIRVRPMIPAGWSLTFTLEYDDTVIVDQQSLLRSMVDAGALVGLGDWRPKYGRFSVTIDEPKDTP